MRHGDTAKNNLLLFAVFLFPVVWMALLVAPSFSGGLPEILKNLVAAMDHPLDIQWVNNSAKDKQSTGTHTNAKNGRADEPYLRHW
jgi:type IV secretion system protein VirD4